MTDFGENTNPHPLEIQDARAAQHKASETQRTFADNLAAAHGALADAEYAYRTALTLRINALKDAGVAATACGDIARGEDEIAELRRWRDKCEGAVEAMKQDAFRLGADRRALDGLVAWSMHRDLRVDTPPADWDQRTGEVRPRAVA